MKATSIAYDTILTALDQIAPVILIDEDNHVVHTNELLWRQLGVSENEYNGQTLGDFIADKRELNDIRRKRSLGIKWQTQVEFQIGDFEPQKARVQFIPVRNQGHDWLLLHIKDVSSYNEAQGSESVLESINRNLREGLYRSTASGEIIYVNDAFIKIFGYNSEAEVRRINSSELYVEPNKREEFKRVLEQKEFVVNQEVLLKKRDGNIFWGLLSTSKSQDEYGNTIYDGALRDISAFKEIEKQLKLEKQRAEEASRAKEQFLSTMSHELRTPMNAVIGMTHLLLSENPKPEQIQNLKTLKFSAENLLSIINDILDFSKIEAGKLELERSRFDLGELLGNIFESFNVKARSKDIELILDKHQDVPNFLVGDAMRISQILNNLISNAIKFTYHGEVRVICAVDHRTDDGTMVKFVVKDTGIGIPQNKLNAIFNLFTQASSSITRKFGGTGLGLTITKRLIELQGGTLEVISQPGFGSEFYFSVFFGHSIEADGAAQNNLDEPEGQSLHGARILVAEDNEVNQILLKKFLKLWGAEMQMADNGMEAIEHLRNDDYDLILMDLQMPVMDGYTASREIRKMEDGKYKDIPIIAVTASALIEVRKNVLEAGMNDYVSKPFSPDQLYAKISEYLPKEN